MNLKSELDLKILLDQGVQKQVPIGVDKKPKLRELKKSIQVGVAEYMYRNIHLLGFENNNKVLNVILRELMDNSLDAATQAGLLPKVSCKITSLKEKKYKVFFQDFGPGVSPETTPDTVCRLLYGNKFNDNAPQRGAQGLGLSGILLYAQKTTGSVARIITKTRNCPCPTEYSLKINIKTNRPEVLSKKKLPIINDYYGPEETGFLVEIDVTAFYIKTGSKATVELLKQYTYLVPSLSLEYEGPGKQNEGDFLIRDRLTDEIPIIATGSKLVPHQIEYGQLLEQIKQNPSKTVLEFFNSFEGKTEDYQTILEQVGIPTNLTVSNLSEYYLKELLNLFSIYFKDLKPQDNCLVELGPSIKKTVTKDGQRVFDNIFNIKSSPIYYKKGVFQIETSAFYGGDTLAADQKIQVYRVANGTPLIYCSSSCAITKTLINYNWKKLNLTHVENELPRGKLILFVHINSNRIPYTSPSKDAIANIPEISNLLTQCLDRLAKSLSVYIKKQQIYKTRLEKLDIIQKVVPDLLKTLQKTLQIEAFLSTIEQQVLKAKIMELIYLVKDKTLSRLRVYNYTKRPYELKLIFDKSQPLNLKLNDDTQIDMDYSGEEFIIEGALPIEYIICDDKGRIY